MTTVSVHPSAAPSAHHARHALGNALRTVRVVAGVTFEVVILGRVDPREPR
ncbi:hypothetical protein [Streptomyces sp. NBC_01803]|uniref:hypothetical protein n=1 Tax=Streptomyces sp. NBC_01803 TaxID=2975946 RepID=UPI002DDC3018|nr:hypothetical protein [Streptomyces sp. NBC_01803]WSA44787.1 hypothetical protein OIE51_11570 [Streptomyces sp. NBC_01803]